MTLIETLCVIDALREAAQKKNNRTPKLEAALNIMVREQKQRELEVEMMFPNNGTYIMRKCSVTGELAVVGSDGMTKAERENYEQIKAQWTSQARK